MQKDIIAFWGYPRKELINEYKTKYPSATWIDLDIDYNYPNLKLVPDNYCTIIKNIYNNAYYLKDRIIAILAPIGKDKCDSAFFVSEISRPEIVTLLVSGFRHSSPNLTLPLAGVGAAVETKRRSTAFTRSTSSLMLKGLRI